ncbi:MAG: hypothetical protein WBP93_03410 [Pyrinomonadaceae bacterium]
MSEEKVVEKHEHVKTETEEGTTESHRHETVVEHDKGEPEVIIEKETTIEQTE